MNQMFVWFFFCFYFYYFCCFADRGNLFFLFNFGTFIYLSIKIGLTFNGNLSYQYYIKYINFPNYFLHYNFCNINIILFMPNHMIVPCYYTLYVDVNIHHVRSVISSENTDGFVSQSDSFLLQHFIKWV